MAEKKGFDLASVLSDVSIPDTGREQIEYIDISNLISDGNNFYSLDGIEELAANIETVGLQQPLRVRPSGAKYVIVSGHRRAAAIRLLVKDGRADLAAVPCIVERGDVSPAMRELRLIYANADTRKMSAADVSKQAERVEALLYQLKEEGYDFPGRMRDHVAEACKVSRTKLARLKVIREKLRPDFLEVFEAGRMPETVAYAIAQESAEHQQKLREHYLDGNAEMLVEWRVLEFFDKLGQLEARRCPGTDEACSFSDTVLKKYRKAHGVYCYCIDSCCVNCYRLAECPYSCISAADAKAEKIKQRAELDAEREGAAEERELQRKTLEQAWRRQWLRVGEAMERAGITPEDLLDELAFAIDADELDALLDGAAEEVSFGLLEPEDDIDDAIKMADLLHTSIDYLLGREGYDTPGAATARYPGKPDWTVCCQQWTTAGEVMERKGLSVDEFIDILPFKIEREKLASYFDGTAAQYDDLLVAPYDTVAYLVKLSAFLRVGYDYILQGDPACDAPAFRHGAPPGEGLYWARFAASGGNVNIVAYYREDTKAWSFPHGASIEAKCCGWWPLPEDKEGSLAPDDT